MLIRSEGLHAWTPHPVYWDGTAYASRADLTGIADSVRGLCLFWYKSNGGTAEEDMLTIKNGSAAIRFVFGIQATTRKVFAWGLQSTGAQVLLATSSVTITNTNWHHIGLSFDLASTANRGFVIDGAIDNSVTWTTYVNTAIDYAPGGGTAWIGSQSAVPAGQFRGSVAEIYFHTPAAYFDLANAANLAKFISGGAPVYLGDSGSFPLGGVQPLICFNSKSLAGWPINVGSGGAFTFAGGALTEGASPVHL